MSTGRQTLGSYQPSKRMLRRYSKHAGFSPAAAKASFTQSRPTLQELELTAIVLGRELASTIDSVVTWHRQGGRGAIRGGQAQRPGCQRKEWCASSASRWFQKEERINS